MRSFILCIILLNGSLGKHQNSNTYQFVQKRTALDLEFLCETVFKLEKKVWQTLFEGFNQVVYNWWAFLFLIFLFQKKINTKLKWNFKVVFLSELFFVIKFFVSELKSSFLGHSHLSTFNWKKIEAKKEIKLIFNQFIAVRIVECHWKAIVWWQLKTHIIHLFL